MCRFFATSPKGLSELLREELISFGAKAVKVQPSGTTFEGDLEVGYRTCLWSRLANRIYLSVLETGLNSQDDLTPAIAGLNWLEHMSENSTFSVSFSGQGLGITHTHYGALKVKDGIVDYFRDHDLERPNVDKERPDIKIHAHVNRNQLTLGIDLSGHSLHQRGYREGAQVTAPLKENVAAAILMRANWPEIAKQGGSFYDPMCGSGTFLIEAAMMASDCAPGLMKANQKGLLTWKGHDAKLWQTLVAEAEAREAEGLRHLPAIYGSDISHRSLDLAEENVIEAGYEDAIEMKQMSVVQGRRWGDWTPGLVVTNPPYGERLGEIEEVKQIYWQLGNYLKAEYEGWQAAVLTCHTELGMYIGIKAKRSHNFSNGPMSCKLFRFDIEPEWYREPAVSPTQDLAVKIAQLQPELAQSAGAIMVANRIKKNLKNLKSWIKQQVIHAYRVYDADLPEYALAIDWYETLEGENWLMVAEYAAPKTVNTSKAKHRLYEAMAALPAVFNIDPENIIFKVRSQQKGSDQYEKMDEQKQYYTVQEGNAKLRVNFTDYLDTGVFLDHRDVRHYAATLATGKSFLNLFCYTATATVQAVMAGAKSSLSVDMSKTYLYWAQHNFWENKIDEKKHLLEQADVLAWLASAAEESVEKKNKSKKFDVIFLDPPSFSTSKRMEQSFDIQRDHVALLNQALSLLTPNGKLIFSTNLRKFKLDLSAFENNWLAENITQKTLPKDFARNSKIHQAWVFSKVE